MVPSWFQCMYCWSSQKALDTSLEAKEQALNTNSITKIYHKDVSNECSLCRSCMEKVLHIVSGCTMLAQKDYKRLHKVCLIIHLVLRKKFVIKVIERWYEHKAKSVIENDTTKVLVGCLHSSG